MLELEAALQRIIDTLPAPQSESIGLRAAHRRVLAETILATCDLPPFDNSSMDGFAVRSGDVAQGSLQNPARLKIIGRVAAGETFGSVVRSGECVRLFTGSPMPQGADAVVMQEDTRPGADTNEILICDAVRTGENVRLRGNDVAAGATLAAPGTVISPGHIALLGATGMGRVLVNRRPRVSLLATGSELSEPGETISPGQIYESNRTMLAALLDSAGAKTEILPIVPDSLPATTNALERAFASSDIVVTSGGASVGEMDFVKAAFERLGGQLDFWKVSMRPGKPFVFGRLGGKFLFGLPGNPVSAFVTFLLLARPALRRWQGAKGTGLRRHQAVLGEVLINRGDRRHFMRVKTGEDGKILSAGQQASHALASLAMADGLVDLPPGAALAAGESVIVLRWD